jgi:hypothetical protein
VLLRRTSVNAAAAGTGRKSTKARCELLHSPTPTNCA